MTSFVWSEAALMRQVEQVLQEPKFLDLALIGQDGACMCSSLLIASVSPLIRSFNEDLSVILLPDLSKLQISKFLHLLLSDRGPRNEFELRQFTEVLSLLGQTFDFENGIGIESETEIEIESAPLLSSPRSPSSPNGFSLFGAKNLQELSHQNFRNGRKLFVCQVCGTEKKGNRAMQQHLIWHGKHPNEDYLSCHICGECGKVCADYNAKKFHVRQVHCERSLKCPHEKCSRAFKTRVALKSHLDIHAGVKNYVCSECGLAFRSKQEMKGHVLRKHSNVSKSIPCELCGKLFRHMSNLKSHFNIHKAQSERPHRCADCNLTFKSEATLKAHLILHDPSRPFKCSKCPLRYKNKDAWVSHESSHDKPQFACQLCDVSYTRKDNLKRHMKDKHK